MKPALRSAVRVHVMSVLCSPGTPGWRTSPSEKVIYKLNCLWKKSTQRSKFVDGLWKMFSSWWCCIQRWWGIVGDLCPHVFVWRRNTYYIKSAQKEQEQQSSESRSDTALKIQELKIMQTHKSCHLTDGFTLVLDNPSSRLCWVGPEIELLAEGWFPIVPGWFSSTDLLIFIEVLLLKYLLLVENCSSGFIKTARSRYAFIQVVGVLR